LSNDLVSRVLDIICSSGGGGIYGVSGILRVSIEEVRNVISLLLAEGILEEVVVGRGGSCSACPLFGVCTSKGRIADLGGIAFYVLTEKGRRICRDRGY